MKVGDLFLALGLIVDDKSWSLGAAAIDKMQAQMKALAVDAVLATTDVKKAMATIGLPAPVKKKLVDATKVTDTFTAALKKLVVGFVALQGARFLTGMITSVTDLGGKLNDLAQTTGQDVEVLQELGYAASQNGSSLDDMAMGLLALSRNMKAAAGGSKEQASAFRKAGIAVKDANGQLRPSEDVLADIADHLASMPDGTNKTATAMKLLGKSGASLIPTLNGGSAGLRAMSEEARALNAVLSKSEIEKLDSFGDDMGRVGAAWQGIKQRIVVALLPTLQKLAKSTLEWLMANREMIAARIESFIQALASALQLLGRAVAFAVEHWRVLAALFAAGAMFTGIMNLIKLITFLQAASTRAAVTSLIAWGLAALPFVIIALLIAGLVILVYKYRDKIKAALKAVGDFFVRLWSRAKNGLEELWSRVSALPGRIKRAFVDAMEAAKQAIRDAVEYVKLKIAEGWKAIRGSWVGKLIGEMPGLGGVVKGADDLANGVVSTNKYGPNGGAPSRSAAGMSTSSASMQNSFGDIVVNTPNGDPEVVKRAVADGVKEAWDKNMGSAFFGVGGR